MTSIGIIPAAGKAQRFGGILKELLPIGYISLMENAITNIEYTCDNIVVVTTPDKIREHALELSNFENIFYVLQYDRRDAWGAILACLQFEADRYCYCYPDVYMPEGVYFGHSNFTISLFDTDKPERFGCLVDGEIRDKDGTLPAPQKAYGALSWSRDVRNFWLHFDAQIETHTQAFNMAINQFGYETNTIDEYHDIASWEDYKELIKNVI